MGRIGGLTETLSQLLEMLGLDLPPWVMPLVALAVFLILLPRILRNMRTSRARKIVLRAHLVEGEHRRQEEAAALALVAEHAPGLVSLADAAHKQGRNALAMEALNLLRARPEARGRSVRREIARLDRTLGENLPGSAEEMAVVLDRLIHAGLFPEARRRLAIGRGRWPRAEALDAVEKALEGVPLES
jgi:hypothetical protein